jgi:hypothetical protein
MHDQRRVSAHGQAAIHRERHIRGTLEFGDDLAQRNRQSLAAKFGRRRQAEPTAFGNLLERFLEAFRRGDAGIVMPDAALEIADPLRS